MALCWGAISRLCVKQVSCWGGGSVMVWGGISWRHKTQLIVVDGHLTARTSLHRWNLRAWGGTVFTQKWWRYAFPTEQCICSFCEANHGLFQSKWCSSSSLACVFAGFKPNWGPLRPARKMCEKPTSSANQPSAACHGATGKMGQHHTDTAFNSKHEVSMPSNTTRY